MLLERYLQGRKLEWDFPVCQMVKESRAWTSERNILGARNFSRFPLSQSAPKKNSRASGIAWGSWKFFGGSWLEELTPIPKRTTVGDRRVLNSKCPKRVGSFGYSTGFLTRRLVRSDNDSIRKLWAYFMLKRVMRPDVCVACFYMHAASWYRESWCRGTSKWSGHALYESLHTCVAHLVLVGDPLQDNCHAHASKIHYWDL